MVGIFTRGFEFGDLFAAMVAEILHEDHLLLGGSR